MNEIKLLINAQYYVYVATFMTRDLHWATLIKIFSLYTFFFN